MDDKIIYTYMGRRQSSGGKIFHAYRSGGNDIHHYGKKLCKVAIGAMFSGTFTGDGVKGPYTFIKFHEDLNELSEWRGIDISIGEQLKAMRDMARVPRNPFDNSLNELRRIYKEVPAKLRHQFIAKIIYEITK